MVRFAGLVGPTYSLRSRNVDVQRCVNLYPEVNELKTAAAGEIGSLISVAGKRLLATLGAGPIRGTYPTSTGKFAVVSGNGLYLVQPDWTYTLEGTLGTITGNVGIADNGTQLIVVDGPAGYIVTMADGAFKQITSDAFLGGTNVVFQDGYFIINNPGTGEFAISALYDGMTWDAADFATAEGSPDPLQTVLSNRRQLWLFGTKTIEVWWNSGAQDFPFSRFDGAFIEYGCAAPWTACKYANTVLWLGSGQNADGIVWMAQAYQPQRISNHSVEQAIQAAGDISTATAYVYQAGGHMFYALNLPNGLTTWVYDISTGQWHERAYLNQGILERDRGECYAHVYNTDVLGDYQNGNLYALDPLVYTDNGNPLKRMRRSPHIVQSMKRMFHHRLTLDAQMGVGLDGTQFGTAPVVSLRWSDDHGNSWSTERSKPLGQIGAYKNRVYFDRLGQSLTRVYEISVTDPVPVVILGAELDIEAGAN